MKLYLNRVDQTQIIEDGSNNTTFKDIFVQMIETIAGKDYNSHESDRKSALVNDKESENDYRQANLLIKTANLDFSKSF